jgi:hypothetical protein
MKVLAFILLSQAQHESRRLRPDFQVAIFCLSRWSDVHQLRISIRRRAALKTGCSAWARNVRIQPSDKSNRSKFSRYLKNDAFSDREHLLLVFTLRVPIQNLYEIWLRLIFLENVAIFGVPHQIFTNRKAKAPKSKEKFALLCDLRDGVVT